MLSSSLLTLSSLATLVVAGCKSGSTPRTHRTKGPARLSAAIPTASSTIPTELVASSVIPSASTPTSTPISTPITVSGFGLPSTGSKVNGIHVGWLPDDGSGGGTSETMAQINLALGGAKASTYGYYAQAQSGTLFDGSQLLSRMADIKAAGGVFQPAVMPIGGWKGLTRADNSQAVAIAKVMQKFVDEGLTVWLRFAHEVNYYQYDGTYQGGVSDFKEGWAVVAAAMRQYSPQTKMWFTPNVADLSVYDQFYPDDPTTVDLIGIDYYPSVGANDFVAKMKPFHDKYTTGTTKFAIGETGLAGAASMQERLDWIKDATSSATASALPNYLALSWFNYDKGYNFKLAAVDGDSITKGYLQ